MLVARAVKPKGATAKDVRIATLFAFLQPVQMRPRVRTVPNSRLRARPPAHGEAMARRFSDWLHVRRGRVGVFRMFFMVRFANFRKFDEVPDYSLFQLPRVLSINSDQ